MAALEDNLARAFQQGLGACGFPDAVVEGLPSEAEDWRLRITVDGRSFHAGFNWRGGLCVRDTTHGTERNLVSNDHARMATAQEAMHRGLRLIAAALANTGFPPRDPPII